MTDWEMTLAFRWLAGLSFAAVAVVLWIARRDDGDVVDAFFWAWMGVVWAMYYYAALDLADYFALLSPAVTKAWRLRAWLAWAPCAATGLGLLIVLVPRLWRRTG